MTPLFWKNKKIFITGHTGFKGSWLCLWLQSLGAELCGYALKPTTQPNLFELAQIANNMQSIIADIRDLEKLQTAIDAFQPDIILHLAAQPLVRYSYEAPVETYSTNVMGTVNLLEAARQCESVKVVLNVTTDKCYENKEWIWAYRENERLGGHDPYSNSKACSELITQSYRDSFYTKLEKGLASARAGNVIGGGDWSTDRLIPDIINSIISEKEIELRYPQAIRPWQHVLEPLSGYLQLAEKCWNEPQIYSEAWNFGPEAQEAVPVHKIVEQMLLQWGSQVKWKDVSNNALHEATYLKLDITKAKELLNWQPRLNLKQALGLTVDWYKAWQARQDMQLFTLQQIKAYEGMLNIPLSCTY
jgi:CDP-glucose 4,6-dehydratase